MAIIKFSTKQSLFALLSLSAVITPVTPTVPSASLADVKRRVKEVNKEVKSSMVDSDRRLDSLCDVYMALFELFLDELDDLPLDLKCSCEQNGGTDTEPDSVTTTCKTCRFCDSDPPANTNATCGTYSFKEKYDFKNLKDTYTDEFEQDEPKKTKNEIEYVEKCKDTADTDCLKESCEVTWDDTKCDSCVIVNDCIQYDCSNVDAARNNMTICGIVGADDLLATPLGGDPECKSGATTAAAATAFTGLMAAGILVLNMM